jgi:TonB family protein
MARRSQLEGRLLAILDSSRERKNPRRALSVLASLLAIPIIAPLAAVQAQSDQQQAPASDRVSVSSAAGLIRQGDTALDQGNFNQAKALYQRALTSLGSGPEGAKVLLHLGVAELATKNVEEAIGDFGKAQEADSAKTGEAQMWMAIARQRQNDLPAASGLYQSALAAQDPSSAAAATTMELYAQLLSQEGRHEQAKAIADQAVAIRKAQGAQVLSASQPSSLDVYQIGGDVKAPTLISKVEPEYSQEARLAKYQGSVLLSVEINVAGKAQNIQVIRGLGVGLDEKAIDAVRRWRFKPGTKYGEPVTTAAKIEVNFRLF